MSIPNRTMSKVLFGDRLHRTMPSINFGNPICIVPGYDAENHRVALPLDESTLSKHLMLIGGIGTGKTNAFFHIVSQLKKKMTPNDVMIVFDTKGDFYNEFYTAGDIVISNDGTAVDEENDPNYWNIFNEIESGPHMQESVIEIAKSIFSQACEKTTQIFFPNAAKDLFMACLLHFIRSVEPAKRTNENLMEYICASPSSELRQMLLSYPDLRAMASYIAVDDSAQTQGVISELQQVVREVFIGNFAQTGTLSLRNIVKNKGGRTVFIEYDLSVGSVLTPVYSLMFDTAIKTALSRNRSEGNVYFITDEFRLLPNLNHIDDAVNFGRSLGVKFMIGIQNVEQIYDNYGEQRARSILSGFSSSLTFRLIDRESKEYIKGIFGQNRKQDAYLPLVQTKGLVEEQRDAYVVEDWDISNLTIGQAIVGLPNSEPFLFLFDRFASK